MSEQEKKQMEIDSIERIRKGLENDFHTILKSIADFKDKDPKMFSQVLKMLKS